MEAPIEDIYCHVETACSHVVAFVIYEEFGSYDIGVPPKCNAFSFTQRFSFNKVIKENSQ